MKLVLTRASDRGRLGGCWRRRRRDEGPASTRSVAARHRRDVWRCTAAPCPRQAPRRWNEGSADDPGIGRPAGSARRSPPQPPPTEGACWCAVVFCVWCFVCVCAVLNRCSRVVSPGVVVMVCGWRPVLPLILRRCFRLMLAAMGDTPSPCGLRCGGAAGLAVVARHRL